MATYKTSILITGGTQGMGYHTALNLAKQQPSTLIVVASRTDREQAATSINKKLNQSNVIYMPLDLSTMAKVRDFAKRWNTAAHPPIQALVLNAAIQFPSGIEYTADGFEAHFGINHIGHALLFHLLVPRLTSDARVVIVSSGVHDPAEKWGLKPAYTTAEKVAHPDAAAVKQSDGMARYSTSKVANVLWALALSRHIASQPSHRDKTVVVLDPGLMFPTNLTRNAGWLTRFVSNHLAFLLVWLIPLLRVVMHDNINTPWESAENLAWLAGGSEVRGKKGVYYERRKEHDVSRQAQDEKLQEELWRWTIEKVADSQEESARFSRIE